MDTVKYASVEYGGSEQIFGPDQYRMYWLTAATDGRRDLAVLDSKAKSTFVVPQSLIKHLELSVSPEASTSPYLFLADFTMYDPGEVTAAELLARYGVTFTRASAANAQTSATEITTIASGAARIGQTTDSATSRGLVVEEARTNLSQDESMVGTGWTAVAVDGYAEAAVFSSPDGETPVTGNYVAINGATADSYGPTLAINAADHAAAVSFFVKDLSGGAAGLAYGVEQLAGTATVVQVAAGSVPTTWSRKWFTATGIKARFAISNSYSKPVALSKVAMALPQIEDLHEFPTEYIDPAVGTRAIDKLSVASTSVIDSGTVNMDVEFIPKWVVPEGTTKYWLWYISANYGAYLLKEDATHYKLCVVVNGTTRTSTTLIDANTIGADLSASTLRLFVQAGAGLKIRAWLSIDGAAPTLVMDAAAVAGSVTGSTVYLFNDNSAASLNAWVKNVAFLKAGAMPYWLVGTEGV